MQSVEDILTFSKAHKGKLQRYFNGGYSKSNTPKLLQKKQKHELNALYFLTVESPMELCGFLRTSFFKLEDLINHPDYKPYALPKKRGGYRQIESPEKKLKTIQRRLNYFLQAYYLCIKPTAVFGFVINPHYLGHACHIAENAKMHTDKKHVLNIDLKDFFPNISASRVQSVFKSSYFNFDAPMATALTLLTTYQGKLPTGAPTSPVLSNFVCLKLDADLKNFCETKALQFTRYADDLTFSSHHQISTDTVLDLINLIKKNGFEINDKKLRLQSSNRKQVVTGLTVNQKVNVDRKLLKKVRAMLHDLATNGLDIATQRHFKISSAVDAKQRSRFISRLGGYINFIGQVRGNNDNIYTKLKHSFDQALEAKRETV